MFEVTETTAVLEVDAVAFAIRVMLLKLKLELLEILVLLDTGHDVAVVGGKTFDGVVV